ncbi:MAG: phosphoglycolate phosphatase [Rhodobiaceae bacterium]|nr:phosphoglycolate phosphatase [Rhodobiaceae bacterium]
MTRPPVAVFDLDGTLVDTAPDLLAALNEALASENLALAGTEQARKAIGHGARAMIVRSLQAQGVPEERDRIDRMHARFLEFYTANICARSLPFPGVEAAIETLAARGVLCAVCTNKYESLAVELLDALGMTNRFAAIAGGDTFGVSKPDPQHLWKTIEAAGGGRAIMVGDSDADVGAAKAAGVPAVAVSFGYSRVPATQLGADAVIDHFDELAALAERLLGL